MPNPSVFDVAEFILRKTGTISAYKLQKLVYYAQAWSLVWDRKPLFREAIRAWVDGPAVGKLFYAHKGKRRVGAVEGDPANLAPEQAETVAAVVDFYSSWEGDELSALTHREEPWKMARGTVPSGVHGNEEISLQSMARFYGSMASETRGKRFPESIRRGIDLLISMPDDEIDALDEPMEEADDLLFWLETGALPA